jgi:hypothetical protein
MASSQILELVQIELSNARNVAENADDGFLLYLIDMAILQAKSKARPHGSIRGRAPQGRSMQRIVNDSHHNGDS